MIRREIDALTAPVPHPQRIREHRRPMASELVKILPQWAVAVLVGIIWIPLIAIFLHTLWKHRQGVPKRAKAVAFWIITYAALGLWFSIPAGAFYLLEEHDVLPEWADLILMILIFIAWIRAAGVILK